MKLRKLANLSILSLVAICYALAQQPGGTNSLDQQLLSAADKGDTATVQSLLQRGANIEAKNSIGDTPLLMAVWSGHIDAVKLLLDKRANIEAKGGWGETPLIRAARVGHADVVKLLLENGADTSATDSENLTAQQVATKYDYADVAALIAQANPRGALNQYIAALNSKPEDLSLREQIITLAASLQPPPAIPSEARDHFMKAAALMQLKNPSQADIQTAVKEFRQALLLAPWWGDAYYNLGRALEADGAFDDAIQQLNFYLKTKPSQADAQDAQARIYAIQAEKQSAARTKEEHERELPLKYVSGGAERVRVADSPASWKPNELHGIFELYGYTVPDENPYYANVFRMPNGRYIAIFLEPDIENCLGSDCNYAGDKIGIADITNDGCSQLTIGYSLGTLAHQTDPLCGYTYSVSISSQPDVIITVSSGQAGIALPVGLLYRGRVVAAVWVDAHTKRIEGEYLQQVTWKQGNVQVVGIGFEDKIERSATDPNVNPLSLVPFDVALYNGPVDVSK